MGGGKWSSRKARFSRSSLPVSDSEHRRAVVNTEGNGMSSKLLIQRN